LGQRTMKRHRLQPFGETAEIGGVVECLDVSARAGNRHAVKQLEEIEVERIQNGFGGSLFRRERGPCVERRLSPAKDLIDVLLRPELFGERSGFTFVSKR